MIRHLFAIASGAIILSAICAVPAQAVSFNFPGVSVNVPLPQQQQCRKQMVEENGETVRRKFCLGPDGQWHEMGAPGGAPPQQQQQAGSRPDGGIADEGPSGCHAVQDIPGWAMLRIVQARLTDRPNSADQIQRMVSQDVQAYWVLDYEAIPDGPNALVWDDVWTGNSAIDSNGNRWQSMRAGSAIGDHKAYAPGEKKTGQLIFINYGHVGAPATIQPVVSVHLAIGQPYGAGKYVDYRLPPISTTCSSVSQPVTSAAPSPELRVPQQTAGPGVHTANAPPDSVKYATQMGFIWAYGEGVYPSYSQSQAWYLEAQRRQSVQRDYTQENEIRRMLADFANTKVIDLLNRGQMAAARGSLEEASFYFGRAAMQGDVQGMAAFGYTFIDGEHPDPKAAVFWCRKAYLGARKTGREYEIDAVNYFCPENAFDALMSPSEKKENQKSIARAKAKSDLIRHQAEAMTALALALSREMFSDGGSGGGRSSARFDPMMDPRNRPTYKPTEYDPPPPVAPIAPLYGVGPAQ